MELSGQFPIRLLCTKTGIPRSSFYNWKKSVEHPPEQKKRLVQSIGLFQEYHGRFPSHGYCWLNAKIRLDKGIVFSDPYAHKCCKIAGIKSLCKHYSYKKAGDPSRTYPNLLLAGINITGPMECVVSDMTAFYVERTYYELTLYMDLWNDELIAHALSSKRGDRMTYLDGLQDVLAFKKQYPNQKLILHSDQGSVYASKSYNELLPMYNIVRSMSRAGTPTDNAAMEAIRWLDQGRTLYRFPYYFAGECPRSGIRLHPLLQRGAPCICPWIPYAEAVSGAVRAKARRCGSLIRVL